MKGVSVMPEILAPAGSFESVLAAVRCGADAVYVGGERFSARAGAANFSDSELEKAVDYCHLHGVKLYRAMNIIVFPEEMSDFLEAAEFTAKAGADGLIVQDLGAAKLLREILPDLKLNASTQMTIHSPQGAKIAAEMGFSRIVAARELSEKQIAELVETGVETEVFIHGALCMSVSGQCYMSAMIGSRSANRGMCAQACRLPFNALGVGERYDLSLKDLCGIEHMRDLAEMGVASFKIEGRMKRAEYVAAAVTACRTALDGKEPDIDTLRAVFSRSGFTDGYITGNIGKPMFGYRRKEDVVSAESVLPTIRETFRKETKAAEADFHLTVKRGKPSELTMRCGDISVTAKGSVPETAEKRPTDSDSARKQLEKLGDTVYTLRNFSTEIDEKLIIPASALNALRREAAELMDKARISTANPEYTVREVSAEYSVRKAYPRKIRVRISNEEQLEAVPKDMEVIIPMKLCGKILPDERYIISPPRFIGNEEKISKSLSELWEMGFSRLSCPNLAYIGIGKCQGFELYGDFGLNIANPFAVSEAARLGLKDVTASFEAKLPQISAINGEIPVGVIVYGRLPVMLTRNCPINQAAGGCKSCKGFLLDRTGRKFPVKCGESECVEIFNSDILTMTDRLDEMNADFAVLNFTDETAEEVSRIIDCCKRGRKALESGFTRGLYYRGVE